MKTRFEEKSRIMLVYLFFSALKVLNTFQGFYTTAKKTVSTDGSLISKSFFPTSTIPLKVNGIFHSNAHSRMSSERLLVVHLVLDQIGAIGSPSHALVEYIRVFSDSTRFHFEEISFDYSNQVLKDNHQQKLQMLCHIFG
jgi:hypothetical protein